MEFVGIELKQANSIMDSISFRDPVSRNHFEINLQLRNVIQHGFCPRWRNYSLKFFSRESMILYRKKPNIVLIHRKRMEKMNSLIWKITWHSSKSPQNLILDIWYLSRYFIRTIFFSIDIYKKKLMMMWQIVRLW